MILISIHPICANLCVAFVPPRVRWCSSFYMLKELFTNKHIHARDREQGSALKMNMLFNTKVVTKRRICDRKIHKDLKFFVDTHNKKLKVPCYSSTKKCM